MCVGKKPGGEDIAPHWLPGAWKQRSRGEEEPRALAWLLGKGRDWQSGPVGKADHADEGDEQVRRPFS